MRPQDIAILLKIALTGTNWVSRNLAYSLAISQSEFSESLNRSVMAGLLAEDKKRVMKDALLEFIEHGLKYVYPQKPGATVRGLYTAHSAPPINAFIHSSEPYVWPWAYGEHRGQSIEPLYKNAPLACKNDPQLYELLALVDVLRVGKIREQQIAINQLQKKLSYNEK